MEISQGKVCTQKLFPQRFSKLIKIMILIINPNLGGLFRGSFFFSGRGGGIISQPPPLSKTRFRQIVPSLTVIVWELCWRFFSSVFSFCKIKGYYLWKYRFYRLCVWNPASRLLEIGRKLIKWQWRHDFLT